MNADTEQRGQRTKLRASRWQREVADAFLEWHATSGVAQVRMQTFAATVSRIVSQQSPLRLHPDAVARSLPEALTACDSLSFESEDEVCAYAGLHLVDRYGRVLQVLEHLMKAGRLPLRRKGVLALEVGAGPAPALYATRDFYADLSRWPDLGNVELGPLAVFDALDSGPGWDRFLHNLSEQLIAMRRTEFGDEGALAFQRSLHDFADLDVRARHHASVARSAERIVEEFDEADEWISDAGARRAAYEDGVGEPSAYDLVFLCNFLTQVDMTTRFEAELRRLARSLTPGGLMILLGGTGTKYQKVSTKVRDIAADAHLRDVSPPAAFEANSPLRKGRFRSRGSSCGERNEQRSIPRRGCPCTFGDPYPAPERQNA